MNLTTTNVLNAYGIQIC